MTIGTNTIIHFFTTPKQLRQLADEMESLAVNATFGDSCSVHEVKTGVHSMYICFDQTEYNKFQNNIENQQWL